MANVFLLSKFGTPKFSHTNPRMVTGISLAEPGCYFWDKVWYIGDGMSVQAPTRFALAMIIAATMIF